LCIIGRSHIPTPLDKWGLNFWENVVKKIKIIILKNIFFKKEIKKNIFSFKFPKLKVFLAAISLKLKQKVV